MQKIDKSHFLWEEKYRPRTFKDLILTNNLIKKFEMMMNEEQMPSFTLASSRPGLGKTSLVHCLMNDLKVETKWYNGSQDRGIDSFKEPLDSFMRHESIYDDVDKKLVVIDESDNLSEAGQKILRGKIEEFAKISSFIMTCNYEHKLISALKSRCPIIDFDAEFNDKKNKKELMTKMVERVSFILTNEKVVYNIRDIGRIVTHFYPSMRDIIKSTQMNIVTENNVKTLVIPEKLDVITDILANVFLLAKNFEYESMKALIDSMSNPNSIYGYIYTNQKLFKDNNSWMLATALSNKYEFQSKTVDHIYLNATTCMIEIMMTKDIELK